MPFTIEDFHDLVRLLEQHPQWQAELRRLVLTQELLELPALVRQQAEAQAHPDGRLDRLEAALARLAEAQVRTEQRVEELAQAQVRTEQRLDRLEAAVARLAETQERMGQQLIALTARVDALAEAQVRTQGQLMQLTTTVGHLDGEILEYRYRSHAPAYFGRLARRLRVVDFSVLADELDAALERGVLSEHDREAVLQADLVLAGLRREDRAEVYLLVEVSAGIGPHDVNRAADRATALARLGRPVIPLVAGRSITREAEVASQTRGVWRVLDGQVQPPGW